jgi:hypothetical protein
MIFKGEITQIGGVKDGPRRLTGPTHTKALLIEVGTHSNPAQSVLEISQDAALELVVKLTPLLKARGCL